MLDKKSKINSVMDVRGRRVHNTFTFSCGVWGQIFQKINKLAEHLHSVSIGLDMGA